MESRIRIYAEKLRQIGHTENFHFWLKVKVNLKDKVNGHRYKVAVKG